MAELNKEKVTQWDQNQDRNDSAHDIDRIIGWKCPPRARVLTLGVIEGYRGRGLEAVMLIEGLKVGFGLGFTEAEASWILEDNVMMCRLLETVQGKVYKTYRIYEKAI